MKICKFEQKSVGALSPTGFESEVRRNVKLAILKFQFLHIRVKHLKHCAADFRRLNRQILFVKRSSFKQSIDE